jgi:CubicO group peptidase (beta-lactamase class C family)
MSIGATATAPIAAQSSPSATPALSAVAEIDAFAKRTGFSGTVVVQHRGRRLVQRHYGLADRSFGVPVDSTTRFWVASITKLFTATLVMQQVEAGRIDLQARIRTYLPDYRGPAADTVQVRQLLNHTSGLEQFEHIASYDDAVRKGMPEYQLPHTSAELLSQYASGPVNTAPGSAFNYNNADYIVLGAILERVSGLSYERLLTERILTPLRLTSTGLLRAQAITPRLATTYMRADTSAPLLRDLPVFPENWWAAGALYSNAADLTTFADALYGGRLLTRPSLDQLLTPGREDYGYGLWVASQNIGGKPHRFAQRPGQIMGANVTLLRYLDDDLTVIILGNTNLADIDRFGFFIGRTVLR